MRKKNIGLCIFLICVYICVLCPVTAFAEGPIAVSTLCDLTVDYHYTDGTKIPGAVFDVYYLAAVDPYVNFTLTPKFAPYSGVISLTGHDVDSWNDLAKTLADYASADSLAPDYTEPTNAAGCFTLSGLDTGLYLVVGQKCSAGGYFYTAKPAIVALPSRNPDPGINDWLYALTVTPKVERETIPVVPSEPAKVERKVLKIWDDAGCEAERPEEITVRLLCDGAVYDTVTLSESTGWSHTWTELPETDSMGAKCEWSVVETPVEGYLISMEQSGITFVITNTGDGGIGGGGDDDPGTPDPPGGGEGDGGGEDMPDNLPQTGMLWWPVPVLACVGLGLVTVGAALRKKEAK